MFGKIKSKRLHAFLRRQGRSRFKLKRNGYGKLRLSVCVSNKHVYAQLINDIQGITLVAASTLEKEVKSQLTCTSNKKAAAAVGELIAKRALEHKIDRDIMFDRGGLKYHGKIRALADSARECGLKF